MKVVQTLLDGLLYHRVNLVFGRLRGFLLVASFLLLGGRSRSIHGIFGKSNFLLAIALAFALAFATVALTRMVCLGILRLLPFDANQRVSAEGRAGLYGICVMLTVLRVVQYRISPTQSM